jgi:hypothetical protein
MCGTVIGIQTHCKSVHKWVNPDERGGDVRAKAA